MRPPPIQAASCIALIVGSWARDFWYTLPEKETKTVADQQVNKGAVYVLRAVDHGRTPTTGVFEGLRAGRTRIG